MIQDLIQRRFSVSYHPHYLATLLHNLGFSYQKARFVSDHLNEAKRLEWRQTRWPRIVRQARQRKALLPLAIKPALPSGTHSAIPRLPRANSPKCPPVANARATKSLA
jgi:hypothetical protein